MPNYTISVIGLGYIGLPTCAAFANSGINVHGVDLNNQVVEIINDGKIHIVEPGLLEIVRKVVKSGKLKASTKTQEADAFVIAVPTPFKGDNFEPDLSYIESAAELIAPVLKDNDLIILESTSPVGTTEYLSEILSSYRKDLIFPHMDKVKNNIYIAHCPERVLPGNIMNEIVNNNRIIGGITPDCSKRARDLYKIFVKGDCILTDSKTAEMSKLVENSFRDVNIAFANELSLICDNKGIDVRELIKLANLHPRVNILSPGCGVGGHCIAVDPWFIVNSDPKNSKLIKTAREINDNKPIWVVEKISDYIKTYLNLHKDKEKSLSLALYGLTFKPNIDDLRESPALEIALMTENLNIPNLYVIEPNILELPPSFKKAKLTDHGFAFKNADIHVFLVNHHEFSIMDKPKEHFLDICGIWPY
jgi:UDP-N-acetyl-D-mannosaminuronic acid dehydrogenase